ncbi:MAG: hypothetical protein HOQ05_01835 [Corynebacteriales bacterium]|nr:hypothetical protein [Mycobacteriales bacterium]
MTTVPPPGDRPEDKPENTPGYQPPPGNTPGGEPPHTPGMPAGGEVPGYQGPTPSTPPGAEPPRYEPPSYTPPANQPPQGGYNEPSPAGPPPPITPMGGGPPSGQWSGRHAADRVDKLSWISLGLGAFSVICCCCCYSGFWAGIPAIITGILGLKKQPTGKGRTIAMIGIILGVIGVILAIWSIAAGQSSTDCDDWPEGDFRDWCEDNN